VGAFRRDSKPCNPVRRSFIYIDWLKQSGSGR
jgi:hypothetical protein